MSSIDAPTALPAAADPKISGEELERVHAGLILHVKRRLAVNALRTIQKHMYVHVFVGGLVVLGFVAGGTGFFYWLFDFLMRQEVFGPPLMDRLVGIVFLAFFSMLVFSNLIITLSTSYISKEVDFLMSQPITYLAVFRQKLIESILYSSWAFAFLSLPLFAAFGMARDVNLLFYPLVVVLIVPFLVIPAALGSIITLLVTAYLPARKTRTLIFVLVVVTIILGIALARTLGIGRMLATAEKDFTQIMSLLETGQAPLMPSTWMTEGLLAIGPAFGPPDFGQYLYWLAMLASTALFLLQVCRWLVPPLYFRGWALSKDSAQRTEASRAGTSPLLLMDRVLAAVLPPKLQALTSKDLKAFWRDPSQWTQLVVLFGLMLIYIINLRGARHYSGTVAAIFEEWRTILAFFNLGATGFVLSILTTRFIYPLLSLEGRGFWSVGLAPMRRTAVVWQKYVLCLTAALLYSVSLQLLSNWILQIPPGFRVLSMATVVTLSAGLTSLSIGIGALMPNFKEDNPARIANGLGGTANALLSLFYIGATVALMVGATLMLNKMDGGQRGTWLTLFIIAGVLLHSTVIVLPMWLGLRRWNRLEF